MGAQTEREVLSPCGIAGKACRGGRDSVLCFFYVFCLVVYGLFIQ